MLLELNKELVNEQNIKSSRILFDKHNVFLTEQPQWGGGGGTVGFTWQSSLCLLMFNGNVYALYLQYFLFCSNFRSGRA